MHEGLHHLHSRKRIYERLEKYPSPSLLKRLFDYLMYAVAILSPLALLPQIFEIYSSHNVAALSLPTWAMLGSINILWTLYGLLHREYPILIASIAFACLNFAGVVGILMYR